MSCNANQYDANCDGCRHCCSIDSLGPDASGAVHPSALADQLDRIRRRERAAGVRRALIRNRASN